MADRTPSRGLGEAVGAVALALLCVAFLGGCVDRGRGDEAPPRTAAATDGGGFVGTYTATLGPPGPELRGPNLAGQWTLELTADREAFFTPPGAKESFPAGNPVTVTGDQVVFARDPQCPTQPGAATPGTYEWRREGDMLRLTELDDSCRDRVFVLTSQQWTKIDK